MEEQLIEELRNLTEAINKNAVPLWISIVGIFVPIAISVAVVIISVFQNRKNKELQEKINEQNERLQRELSHKELKMQMHSDIMKIYDDFCLAHNAMLLTGGKSHMAFSNFTSENWPNLPFNYVTGINNAFSALIKAVDRAMLIIPKQDDEFRTVLKNILDKYKDLNEQIDYYYRGIAINVSNIAWQQIVQNYPNILIYDYRTLEGNQEAYKTYLERCKTETTTDIDKKTAELVELFKYENFDKYFEKYLRMDAE